MSVGIQRLGRTLLITEARVRHAERISPAFVRVTLTSDAFSDLGIEGFDTRITLVFAGPSGELPEIPDDSEDWYAHWLAMPDETRSPMRTYTIRDVLEEDGARMLVVDMVVHEDGLQGPACRWALAAQAGDRIQVIAPHRGTRAYAGTEFTPGECRDLLLVADETALPALARILADVGPDFTGHAFVEVPSAADITSLEVPPGIGLTWLVRDGAEHGRRVVEEVRSFLGLAALDPTDVPPDVPSERVADVWETARYSSSGEDVQAPSQQSTIGCDQSRLYAWIAGESWLVTALRRSLVTGLNLDRSQVAFMGYWRQGVSMKS